MKRLASRAVLVLPGELDFVEFAQSISVQPEPQIMADGDTYSIDLTQDDREAAKTLKRTLALSPSFFEPESVTLQGSIPFEAASMGTKETVKWITLTYLTIDRLVRGSVEVKQLHGPVGILDVGAKTAAQGLTYLLFFLGLLSVNLAVLNFLPLPVVDGGHMIFLGLGRCDWPAPICHVPKMGNHARIGSSGIAVCGHLLQ